MEKLIRTEEGGRRSRELIRVWRESYWPSEQMAERELVAVRANGGERYGESDSPGKIAWRETES